MLSVGLIDKRVSVAIDEQKHGCIYGQTGYGKSMLLYLLLTTMLFRNRAFFLIDGAGDLVSDLCAWLRKQAMDAEDVVVIKVSPQCLFHFDPFDAEGRTGKEYRAWLDAKVKRVAREFIRSSGQFNFNETKRMERWLKNAIYACGVDYEPGRHLGLDRMLDILNVGSAEWETLFLQVAPHVPYDVASDLWELRKDSPHIRDKKIESTVNRLRSFLTPMVKEILRTSDAPSLRSAIRQGKTVLCDLAANGDFDHEDSVTLGGLLISEVMEAKETERDHRRPLTLFIDEAEAYIGKDISSGLTVGRHWGLNFWFSFQTLSSMKNEMIDMTRKIAFSADGSRIRANQGHSLPIDLGLVPVEPPELLYHGTVPRFLDSIRRDGLTKGTRHHVHLSPDTPTATKVGERRGRPIVLVIEAGRMFRDGHKFYRSENGVWLTDAVPPEYIR